jgi:hypothetical protein
MVLRLRGNACEVDIFENNILCSCCESSTACPKTANKYVFDVNCLVEVKE